MPSGSAASAVIITGASSGIGRALAIEFGRRGRPVGLLARREPELAEVAAAIARAGGKAAWAAVDVTDAASVQVAVQRLEAELGPVAIMVANAGGSFEPKTDEPLAPAARRTFELNFMGMLHAFDAVLPGMKARSEGTIVAVSSLAGWRGLPFGGTYSAVKAAMRTCMESLRVQLRPRGIAAVNIDPGFVRTPMTEKNRFPMPFLMEADEAARIMATGILAGRSQVDFPFLLALVMRIVRLMPNWVYDRVIRLAF